MLLDDLNYFTNIVRTKRMMYFKNNIQKLKEYINKLKELKSINSIAQSKELYYTLLELLELLQEDQENKNIDYDIIQLENKFLDYIGIAKESLK